MKALKRSNRLFQFHVLKCVNCFLLVWYSKVIFFFFFNRKKRKEMSDLSVMKVMTCFSPRWDFHAPVRAAAGGVMFSGYPSICPVLTIVISPEEFQIWPNSSLRLEKNQWNFNSTFYIQRGHRSATSWCHNVAKTINSSDHYSPS